MRPTARQRANPRQPKEHDKMLKATKGKILPTAIIGSLPRPSWYTENPGTRSFVDAMANNRCSRTSLRSTC